MLMRKHFPQVDYSKLEWKNIADVGGINQAELNSYLKTYIKSDMVLIEQNRRNGNFINKNEVANYVNLNYGNEGHILITSREFDGFVVLAQNGVISGWL